MTKPTHDRVRLAAIVLNVVAAFWGAMMMLAAVRAPLSAWDAKSLFLVVLSLAPFAALLAIMTTPDDHGVDHQANR